MTNQNHHNQYSPLRPWQTRTQCCGHIVAGTNVSPFARAHNICCGHKFCVRDPKNFLFLFGNILCPQQMSPSLRSMETQHLFCVPRVCASKDVRANFFCFPVHTPRHIHTYIHTLFVPNGLFRKVVGLVSAKTVNV